MGQRARRVGLVATAAAAATAATVGVTPSPASAGIHPSGCTQWATFASFSANCWLGKSGAYENTDAGFIYGIQWAIGEPYNGNYTMENDFTPAIEKRVIDYQNQRGLSADGIVGSASWSAFQSDLVWRNCGTFGSRYYAGGGIPCGCDGGQFFLSTLTAPWWTLEPSTFTTNPRNAHSFSVDYITTT